MLSIYITLAIAAFQIGYGSAVPQPTPSVSSSSIIPGLTAGYTNPILSYSKGGNAICVTGNVPISITATTTHILLPEPANQTVLTEIIQEFIQVDSNIVTRTDGGSVTTQGTFSIDTTYCVPANPSVNPKSIQLLIHGLSLDKTYWDIAPGYSYVDAAALAGYATIAYNRLGVGNSDHPDPLQVVQGTVDVEIQHGLTQLLRNGWVNGRKYQNVVAAGHSYGSIVLLAQAAKYPSDVQAAIITGFVNDLAYIGYTLGSLDPAIAALNDPAEFGSLPYGYMVPDTSISVQLPFFRFPYFPASAFNEVYAHKQPISLGQVLAIGGIYAPALNFVGPVDVVAGQHDFPFCLGDCDYPTDLTAATIPQLFPAASSGSESFIVPNSGHVINAHYEAGTQFSQINAFLSKNGF